MGTKAPKRKRPERTMTIDDGDAFIPDATRGHGNGNLPEDAEADAEEFIAQATSAEDVGEDARDEWVDEELGGPFLEVHVNPDVAAFATTDDDDEVPEAYV